MSSSLSLILSLILAWLINQAKLEFFYFSWRAKLEHALLDKTRFIYNPSGREYLSTFLVHWTWNNTYPKNWSSISLKVHLVHRMKGLSNIWNSWPHTSNNSWDKFSNSLDEFRTSWILNPRNHFQSAWFTKLQTVTFKEVTFNGDFSSNLLLVPNS